MRTTEAVSSLPTQTCNAGNLPAAIAEAAGAAPGRRHESVMFAPYGSDGSPSGSTTP